MKGLYEKLKERLFLIENMYDVIRIVNPINKQITVIKDNGIENIKGSCYDMWNKGKTCHNCVSYKAYNEKDTFVKIEHTGSRIFLIVSSPLQIEGEMYVIEMMKDISKNGIIEGIALDDKNEVTLLIDEMNEKIAGNELTMGMAVEEPSDDDDENIDVRLFKLDRRIQELRDALNEMCIASEDKTDYKLRLETSQYLDELIVEYMKNVQLKELSSISIM